MGFWYISRSLKSLQGLLWSANKWYKSHVNKVERESYACDGLETRGQFIASTSEKEDRKRERGRTEEEMVIRMLVGIGMGS